MPSFGMQVYIQIEHSYIKLAPLNEVFLLRTVLKQINVCSLMFVFQNHTVHTQPNPPSFTQRMLFPPVPSLGAGSAVVGSPLASDPPGICFRLMFHLHDLHHEQVNWLILFPNGQNGVHYSLWDNS